MLQYIGEQEDAAEIGLVSASWIYKESTATELEAGRFLHSNVVIVGQLFFVEKNAKQYVCTKSKGFACKGLKHLSFWVKSSVD